MSIHDEADYPWLIPEKLLIAICLERNKYVLGVCLGLSCWEGHFVGKRRTTCVVACPPSLTRFWEKVFSYFSDIENGQKWASPKRDSPTQECIPD
jgi:hypothetical protein